MSVEVRVPGFRFGGLAAGIKQDGAPDLALAVADTPASAAGTFTRNALRAPPVELSERRLRGNVAQAVLINSGCANAGTGVEGLRDAEAMAQGAASALKVPPSRVLVCSTGVIGPRLPMKKIRAGVPKLARALSVEGLPDFAEAIRTTDTRPKLASLQGEVAGERVTVAGAAKGAGMIAPQMATMLAFVFTDALVERALLARLWKQIVARTFNIITVDGDTSTNDTALVLASGAARNPILHNRASQGAAVFESLLHDVARDLAEQIVGDGEGATKVVEVLVEGALNEADAMRIARRIAESPLVKTAIHGGDPNWGRIAAAIGNAARRVRPQSISLWIGDVAFVEKGQEVPGAERAAHRVMQQDRYALRVALGLGSGKARMLTCDLGPGYIEINAHYRT